MAEHRRNILLIMADQHRADYVGAAGADFVRTPNLDRLAARGTRIANCFTNAPICAPARIGLATAMQPARFASLDNEGFLPASARTYYQRLRDAGYRVGCIGKLDLAKSSNFNGRDGRRPCVFGWGFTHPLECEGKMHAGSRATPQGPYGFWLQDRGLYDTFHQDYQNRRARGWRIGVSHDSALPTEAYEDSFIGRQAAEWIENIPDDFPWHCFVSFVGPHDPFDPPTEYADRYRVAAMPSPISDAMAGKPGWVHRRVEQATPEQVIETRRQYCASVELIDAEIGRILDALERRGMAEDTYVIYVSDHGEMLGDHGMYHKSCAYEPAVRVPLIAAGAGIAAGQTSDALVELIDLNPTICELAGLRQQENIDARPFTKILRGSQTEHRADVVTALRNFRAIRTDRFKFIENYNDIAELYDLRNDPEELTNLADQQPNVCKDLRARMTARFVEGMWRR